MLDAFVAQGITPLAEAGAEYPLGQLWYQLALSQADRQFVNDYQLYENPVDWQGDEVTYATETLKEYVDKGYIASDVSSVKAEDAGVSFINGTAPIFVSGSWWFGRFVEQAGFDWTLQAVPGLEALARVVGQPVGRARERGQQGARVRVHRHHDASRDPGDHRQQRRRPRRRGPRRHHRPEEPGAHRRRSTESSTTTASRSTPTGPRAGFYDVIVRELQGLVTGTQDAETTNANLGAEYEEGTADFR